MLAGKRIILDPGPSGSENPIRIDTPTGTITRPTATRLPVPPAARKASIFSAKARASALHPLVKAAGKKYRTTGPCRS